MYEEITSEIEASEPGPGTVAFFDFDGTIIFGFSIASLFIERVTSGQLPPADAIRQFFQLLGHGLNGSDYSILIEEAAESLAGTRESDFIAAGESIFDKYLAGAVYPESRALIRAHQRQGHTVVILSSATRYQIDPTAKELDIDHVLCNHFEVLNGEFSGEVREPIVFADGKLKAAEDFVSDRGTNLQQAFFYSDGYELSPWPRQASCDSHDRERAPGLAGLSSCATRRREA